MHGELGTPEIHNELMHHEFSDVETQVIGSNIVFLGCNILKTEYYFVCMECRKPNAWQREYFKAKSQRNAVIKSCKPESVVGDVMHIENF